MSHVEKARHPLAIFRSPGRKNLVALPFRVHYQVLSRLRGERPHNHSKESTLSHFECVLTWG
jgi:hypothetical protein